MFNKNVLFSGDCSRGTFLNTSVQCEPCPSEHGAYKADENTGYFEQCNPGYNSENKETEKTNCTSCEKEYYSEERPLICRKLGNESISDDTFSNDTFSDDTFSNDTFSNDFSSNGTSSNETSSNDTFSFNTSSHETSYRRTISDNSNSNEIASDDNLLNDTLSNDTTFNSAPTNSTRCQQEECKQEHRHINDIRKMAENITSEKDQIAVSRDMKNLAEGSSTGRRLDVSQGEYNGSRSEKEY